MICRYLASPVFGEVGASFIRETNEILYEQINLPMFFALANGQEIAGLEGLRGPALDRGMVEREQREVTALLNAMDSARRRDVIASINWAFREAIPFVNMPESMARTLEHDFSGRNFDFGSEADRVRIGVGMVLRIRYSR